LIRTRRCEMGMIKRDYKWPSTGRRRREERARKMFELMSFGVSINLIAIGLYSLVPNGGWVFLALLIIGVAGLTAQVTRMMGE